MTGVYWGGEEQGCAAGLCWQRGSPDCGFLNGQVLKQLLLVLHLGRCCHHPFLGSVEDGWDRGVRTRGPYHAVASLVPRGSVRLSGCAVSACLLATLLELNISFLRAVSVGHAGCRVPVKPPCPKAFLCPPSPCSLLHPRRAPQAQAGVAWVPCSVEALSQRRLQPQRCLCGTRG